MVPTAASAVHDREGGFTLVELLVTIVIMGLAIAALLGGLGTAIIVSDQHRQQAVAGSALRSYAEAVAAMTYTECASAGTFASPAGYTSPTGYTSSATGVRYWKPSTRSFEASCESAGAQRVTLRVASNRGGAAETIEIVVRKATA